MRLLELSGIDQFLIPTGTPGIYGRTGRYRAVFEGVRGLITTMRETAEVVDFPPIMNREFVHRTGYVKTFPHLLGSISGFSGDDGDAASLLEESDFARRWEQACTPTSVVACPAACYSVYPMLASRGRSWDAGHVVDTQCDCFRNEPSEDIDRLQSFRMREFVFVGSAPDAVRFRDDSARSGLELMEALNLVGQLEVAHDPFFGRTGEILARSQLGQGLKYEILCQLPGASKPTALMSFNCHQDHFGSIWRLGLDTGEPAHSACAAFGLDRLVIALVFVHGSQIDGWPAELRRRLGL